MDYSILQLKPINLKEARAFVKANHRHHPPNNGWKFGIGLLDMNGDDPDQPELVGVIVAEPPRARMLNDGYTLELTMVCTIGSKNACSILLSAACRAAKGLGYRRVFTYTLPEEGGSSLLASGFQQDHFVKAQAWGRPSRPRESQLSLELGDKWRWVRHLKQKNRRS